MPNASAKLLAILLIVGSLAMMTGFHLSFVPRWLHHPWFKFLVNTPFWCGRQFYRGAWQAFQHRISDLNSLIAFGRILAYFYCVFATGFPTFFI